MTKITDTIRSYFTGNPGADKFHFTSDEQAFSREKDAHDHAKELKRRGQDETVTIVTRAEAFAEKAAVGPTPLELAQNALGKAEGKVEKAGAKVKNSADAMMKAEEALKLAEEAKKALAEDATQKVKDKAQAAIDKAAEALQKAADQHKMNLDAMALAGAEAAEAAKAVEELKGVE